MAGAGTVWLVGMMGAGKSTVGRKLADLLGRRFIDADAEIERAAGRSVAEVFATEGEAAFRRREARVVDELRGSGAVVALGGGAVAQPRVREAVTSSGVAVYLRASAETLLERVGDADERPLLAGLSGNARLGRLRALLGEREEAYACASIAVDTDDLAPEAVAERVMAALGEGVARSTPGGSA